MTETEVLEFLQYLGARVSTELGLELDGAALRRIAALVFALFALTTLKLR